MILTFLNEGFCSRELNEPSGSNLTCDIETNKRKAWTFVFFSHFSSPDSPGVIHVRTHLNMRTSSLIMEMFGVYQ